MAKVVHRGITGELHHVEEAGKSEDGEQLFLMMRLPY